MKSHHWISILFGATAAYDAALGLLFLFAPEAPFKHFEVTLPNHIGYVQFPAAVLLIFGLMFLRVALSPLQHRELMFYGILLKASFVGVAGWHWLHTGLPLMWKPFVVIDLITGLLFVVAFVATGVRVAIND